MATALALTLDMIKMNAFIRQLVKGLGAPIRAGMFVMGKKLGSSKAFTQGPETSAELGRKSGTSSLFPSPGKSNLGKETDMPKYVIEHVHRIGDRSLSREDLIKLNATGQFFVRFGPPFWQGKGKLTRSPKPDPASRRTKTSLRIAVCVNTISVETNAVAVPSAVQKIC